jgi:phosphoribosylformylglycinamidine synthase
MDAWRVEVRTRAGLPDPAGASARAALAEAGAPPRAVRALRGYLLGAGLDRAQVARFAAEVLADPISDEAAIFAPTERAPAAAGALALYVAPRPGVTDPVAGSVRRALRDAGLPDVATGTYRGYEIDAGATSQERLQRAAARALANAVIHELTAGERPRGLPAPLPAPDPSVRAVALRGLDDDALAQVSRDGGLALEVREMRAIRAHFEELGRDPSDLELETIAQTWSEHCKHKTLTAAIRFGGTLIDNLLRSTIASVTKDLARPFCVSVFEDNAGIIDFDGEDCVCIKVETHNHPSAIEPFGGAGTGVGGVIRDVLGTGLGARPIASTDVFCVAPPDTPADQVPAGCLHPRQILRGVVAGVRDYGNPMGIPTVNGAVHFDPDFIGNPLVYVGNVGILPRSKAFKKPRAGDAIVVIGGRTGRDGIHGATFSSLELHTKSETISSGAVQIGDPITERKAMDAVLRARDEELFSAITDCGAGGFSSAVGEMAQGLGAEVALERAPLKYQGLRPWEIWISEAQERMVLAVPPDKLARLRELCAEEDVELSEIGAFTDSGRLVVRYGDAVHCVLDLEFLHDGLPRVEREASWAAPELHDPDLPAETDLAAALCAVLADPNIASKEWIIRQYDHEVQAASAGKPLCGVREDGPADAAVLAPKLGSRRGIVLASGLNPRYSRIDPAAMAECAIDEALRNVVAVGGDPEFTAILDNYCWGNTARPERLGALVRATQALCDVARVYRTPFVSGKDSLNNEYRDGERTIVIPGCILVTALSVIADVERTIGSALRRAGNRIFVVGTTRLELGGSAYWKSRGELGASVPRVDAHSGKATLDAVARAIAARAAAACHDLSEGGLGVAAAEMAFGGRLGLELDLDAVPAGPGVTRPEEILFSESQSRFLLEVAPDRVADLEANLDGVVFAEIGTVTEAPALLCRHEGREVLRAPIATLYEAWRRPLDFDRQEAQP